MLHAALRLLAGSMSGAHEQAATIRAKTLCASWQSLVLWAMLSSLRLRRVLGTLHDRGRTPARSATAHLWRPGWRRCSSGPRGKLPRCSRTRTCGDRVRDEGRRGAGEAHQGCTIWLAPGWLATCKQLGNTRATAFTTAGPPRNPGCANTRCWSLRCRAPAHQDAHMVTVSENESLLHRKCRRLHRGSSCGLVSTHVHHPCRC